MGQPLEASTLPAMNTMSAVLPGSQPAANAMNPTQAPAPIAPGFGSPANK